MCKVGNSYPEVSLQRVFVESAAYPGPEAAGGAAHLAEAHEARALGGSEHTQQELPHYTHKQLIQRHKDLFFNYIKKSIFPNLRVKIL